MSSEQFNARSGWGLGQSYCDLIVWQKAMKLAAEIYQITDGFPGKEIYGLTSQIRRAAVSVPSNIAEGQGRLTHKEFRHFLGNARGSLLELETQVRIAVDLKYLGAQPETKSSNSPPK